MKPSSETLSIIESEAADLWARDNRLWGEGLLAMTYFAKQLVYNQEFLKSLSPETTSIDGMVDCVICNGVGKLPEPMHMVIDLKKERVKIANSLKNAGYSHRQIMKIMNYKSPLSIHLLLKEQL